MAGAVGFQRGRRALVALALVLFAPHAAVAKKPKRNVVLFPIIERDSPDATTVASVADLLDKASTMLDSISVLAGPALKKKIKAPEEAIGECGTDLGCMAKLGKKLKAAEVLLGRASPEGSGVVISFLVIDVKKKDVARKMSLTFPSSDDVKAVLGAAIYELYGITDPGFVKIEGATGVVRADGRIIGKGEGPHKLKPGLHEIDVSGQVLTAMVVPGKTKNVSMSEARPAGEGSAVASAEAVPLEAPPPPPPSEGKPAKEGKPGRSAEDSALAELALLPLDPMADPGAAASPEPSGGSAGGPSSGASSSGSSGSSSTSSEKPELIAAVHEPGPTSAPPPPADDGGGGPGLLTWIGAGAGAVGAAAVGVGAFFFVDSAAMRQRVYDGAPERGGNMTMIEGDALDKTAVTNNHISIGLLVAGGVVALGGATLATLDLFVLAPKATVEVTAGGARASLGFAW